MDKSIQKYGTQELRKKDDDAVVPVETQTNPFPFFSFQYSYREISSFGGKTHIRARQTRFADGKLETEEFEGSTDASAYETMVVEAQKRFLDQMNAFFTQLGRFFPR